MRKVSRTLSLLAVLAIVAGGAAGASANASTKRYIVTFVDGTNASSEAARMRASGWSVRHTYSAVFPGVAVELPAAAADALRRNPRVALVEEDGVVSLDGSQSGATWGIDRIDQPARPLNGTYVYPDTAGSGVRMYVVDTGVLSSHSEFSGRVDAGYSTISDGRGTSDCNGHGTHVAGTAAGTVYGVAKLATIVPVRVLDCAGSGSWSGVIAGIDWIVATNGGRPAVANLSLGGGANSSVDAAVSRAHAAGVTMVVAAGNANADACRYSPARVPEALTIGATTSADSRASYSNFGSCLDLFAPGSSITSAWYTSTSATNTISGTSMAAPHVAGVAALLLATDLATDPSSVSSAIVTGATAGVVSSAGSRSPNLLLFSGVANPAPPSVDPLPGSFSKSSPSDGSTNVSRRGATLSWTASADAASYEYCLSTSQTCSTWRSTSGTSVNTGGLNRTTTYYWQVRAVNGSGVTLASEGTWRFTTGR